MDKISKFREKLVDNFKNIFTDIKCEIFILWINVMSFVNLGALSLTVFVNYCCIQISKLRLKRDFVIVHNDYWYRTMNIWKTSDSQKRFWYSSFSCESCFYLLLSLASIMFLYLCYTLFYL